MFSRGSEWHKWDLHVHTKGTNKNDQYACSDFEEFCKILFSKAIENNISAIGVTDYFSIDNYQKVINYQKEIDGNVDFTEEEKDKIKSIFIIPNVELRMIPVTDSGQLVNIHLLFNPSYVSALENDFFTELKFNEYRMNRAGLIALGKHENPTASTDEEAYKIGVNNFIVTPDGLKELLQRENFRNNSIVVVSNSSNDGNSGYQQHYSLFENDADSSLDALRRSIYRLSDCIFSGNPNDTTYFLGKGRADTPDEIKRKCGSLKPCIHGSDAHCEEKLFNPDQKRYCWIKADLTFEGLRQIIFEPERVKIQEHCPENKSGYHVIDTITLNKDGIWHGTVGLNPYLNTIIGGRSTGKSTLLQSIAKKINPTITLPSQTENSEDFINTLLDGISIKWKDGVEDASREIEFFSQNYMYTLATDNTKLTELIQSIIQERDTEKKYEEYKLFCNDNKIALGTLLNKLFLLEQAVQTKHKELLEKGDKQGIEAEIKQIGDKIQTIKANASITQEELEKYNSIVEAITKEDNLIKKYQDDITQLKGFIGLSLFDAQYSNKFILLSEELREQITKSYQTIVNETNKKWQEHITQQVHSLEVTIDSIQTSIQKKKEDEIYKKGDHYFRSNAEYLELQKLLENERKKLSVFVESEKQLRNLMDEKDSLKKEIVTKHKEYKTKCDDIAKHLQYKEEDVNIAASEDFYKKRLYEFLQARHNVRSYANSDYVRDFVNNYDCIDKSEESLNQYIEDCLAHVIEYKGGHVNQNVLLELITTNWYGIKYELTYEKDLFREMSPGKKSFVVLKLLLDFSSKQCPILIDQPEDSLDNRAIYNELVEYIRTKKQQRQIILVTHNSNVVVGSDAENVIVANQHGDDCPNINNDKFQYINGAIENTKEKDKTCPTILLSQGIREHICEILEGGKDAFEKREQRYGLR